ncbi:putative Small-conductance mechanosensitive channel MscS [Nitrospira defluvii]|uniref:Putative Small-conductance mechanosensitive channel MscS n=1 Tax=Nitrospira defluvii TaxID=330214 RepID=D8P7Y5_9BACT|nr:putative Small-conductance mechanosensitive channel MscS [Nitrospira defluvii]
MEAAMKRCLGYCGYVLCVLYLFNLSSTHALSAPSSFIGETPVKQVREAPVVYLGESLFTLHQKVGSFTPDQRAEAIQARLKQVARNPFTNFNAIAVADTEHGTDIALEGLVLLTVTDGDAKPSGQSRQELAREYASKIRTMLFKTQEELSTEQLLTEGALAIAATAVLIAILLTFHKIFPKIYGRIELWQGTHIKAIKIQRVEVFSAQTLTKQIMALARGARFALTLVFLYIYLTTVLGLFPWTRQLASTLVHAVVTTVTTIAQTFLSALPDLAAIIVIIMVTRYIIKLIQLVFNGIQRGAITLTGFHRDWADPTFKIVRFLVIAFAAIAIFPYIPGSHSEAFRGVSVFLGVLFSLGSAGAVSNAIAGIILTYMRPFQLGDRVKMADTVGDVTEKTLLVTRIRTIKNVDITIPNSLILGAHIINYSSTSLAAPPLILNTSATIGYDVPWRTVHDLLKKAALATRNILSEPEPFVLQTALNDFYVTYELNAYTGAPNQMAVTYSNLHQNIQDVFNEAGVEIMSPHYAQVRDGNKTTIPESYLPGTYQVPAFRIEPLDRILGKPSPAASPPESATP